MFTRWISDCTPLQEGGVQQEGKNEFAATNLFLQFQADCLGLPAVRLRVGETTVLGAAFLAVLQDGVRHGLEEAERLWVPECVFEPCRDRSPVKAAYAGWKKAVPLARDWPGRTG